MVRPLLSLALLLAAATFGPAACAGPVSSPSSSPSSSPFSLSPLGDSCPTTGKKDCGFAGIDEVECQQKNCCWQVVKGDPYCFFAEGATPQYYVEEVSFADASNGSSLLFKLKADSAQTKYGEQPVEINALVTAYSDETVQIKITDPAKKRYEIPEGVIALEKPRSPKLSVGLSELFAAPSSPVDFPKYAISFPAAGKPFFVNVTRKADNVVIFSLDELQFAEQYLRVANRFPALKNYPNIYGLGEHMDPLRLSANTHTYTMFAADIATPVDTNLYGSHPFYLHLLDDGKAHGVYLHNSNGMEVTVELDKVVFESIGGLLDLFVFVGSRPEEVTQQYQRLIGLPMMPAHWALGWHQCRWGYKGVEELEDVVSNYTAAGIPLDVMWTDIDYMDAKKDFTWSPKAFPQDKMKAFVDKLHQEDKKYVLILDPAIHNEAGYETYENGLKYDVFIKEGGSKQVYIGKVWPGSTAYPDFTDPKTKQWWKQEIEKFLQGVDVDGLWIDMNEPSNFVAGPSTTNNTLNNPPFAINNRNSYAPLNTATLSMDTLHHDGELHYNLHNLYGLSEAIATHEALVELTKKRPFVLSRSTFASSGKWTAHWGGDNHSTWASMLLSISHIVSMNIFGIPLMGSDICGFNWDTNEELCARWSALGCFYPFSRNHNSIDSTSQEPYLWPSVTAVMKKGLAARYSINPYLYTAFYAVHKRGGTVATPVFFEFPEDSQTYGLSAQFLLGKSLLVSPVVTQGATSVQAYFPPASLWYDFWTGAPLKKTGLQTVACALEDIVVSIRGGSVLARQFASTSLAATRGKDFYLTVAPTASHGAQGELFWDDGEQLEVGRDGLEVRFDYANGTLTSHVELNGLSEEAATGLPPLSTIQVLNVWVKNLDITVNGKTVNTWDVDTTNGVLSIYNLNLSLKEEFKIVL